MPLPIATERVYATDANGVRRLVATPGDPIPVVLPAYGIVTVPDPVEAALVPLEGYDALTEAQVLDLIAGLSPGELAAVQAYEAAHHARGSITRYGHVSTVVRGGRGPAAPTVEVPAESTSGGYEAMAPADLAAEVQRRGLAVSGTGAGGNVLKKDQVAALQADDAKLDRSV